MKKIWLSLLPFIIITGCNDAPAEPEQATAPTEAIASDLKTPWAINKLNDEFYISERTGTVAHVESSGKVIHPSTGLAGSAMSMLMARKFTL